MWRVGYGDGEDSHSTKVRKLEPFMASQAFANVNSRIYSSSIPTTPLRGHLHNTNLPAVGHHLVRATDKQQQKRRGNSNNIEQVGMAASSRWNPTPEQLYDLEDMYRSGTRTPTTKQIQQIALKLRRFGKIEGKNVFYWFQNHKARERQRRRRHEQMLNASSLTEKPLHIDKRSLQTKQSGLSRTCFEVGQTKNMVTPSNSSTISEESVSMPTNIAAKSKTDEGIEIEVTEFQQKNSSKKHAMKKSLEGEREYQTLELFPLPQSHCDRKRQTIGLAKDDSEWQQMRNSCNKPTPTQFFEFLPLKRN